MITWLVTWMVLSTVFSTCPQAPPYEDAFGRVYQSDTVLTVSCFETVRKPMRREFTDRDSAERFVAELRKHADEHFSSFTPFPDQHKLVDIKLIRQEVVE